MKKFLIIFFLTFLALCVGAYIYVAKVFIPYKLKGVIASKLEETTGRKISYDSIEFRFPLGLEINNITVYENDSEEIFLKLSKASLSVLLTNFLQSQSIIIPTIKLSSPYVHLIRKTADQWNFSDLKKSDGPSSDSKKSVNILVRKIILENGTLEITDKGSPEEFNEILENLNVSATLHVNKTADFKFSTIIAKTSSSLEASGVYSIDDKALKGNVNLKNISAAAYIKRFHNIDAIRLNDGHIASAQFAIEYAPGQLAAQGFAELSSIFIESKDTPQSEPSLLQRLKSNLKLENLSIKVNGSSVEASTNAQLSSTQVFLRDGRSFDGNINAKIQSLRLDKGVLTVKGDLFAPEVKIQPAENQKIWGNLSVLNAVLIKKDSTIQFKSDINLQNSSIRLPDERSMSGDLTLPQNQLTFQNGNLNLQTGLNLKNATISISPKTVFTGSLTSSLIKLIIIDHILSTSGAVDVSEGFLKIDDEKNFKGNPRITFSAQTDLTDPSQLSYNGKINLSDTEVAGLPNIQSLSHLSGDLDFRNDLIKTQNVSFNTLGSKFTASGSISSFDNPSANLEIITDDIDFDKVFAALPAETLQKVPVGLKGHASMHTKYNGLLNAPDKAEISCTAGLKDVTVTHPKLPSTITNLNGEVNYAKDLLVWKDIKANYDNNAYTSSGKVLNFKTPTVDIDLSSKDIVFTAQVEPKDNILQINDMRGKVFNSSFDVAGSADIKNPESPILNLSLNATTDLNDLQKLPIKIDDKIKNINPQGKITIKAAVSGGIKDWRLLSIDLAASSDRLTLATYPLDGFALSYLQKDGTIERFDITGKIYDGELKILTRGTIKNEGMPIEMSLGLERLNLATLRKNQKLKVNDLQGMLSVDLALNGPVLFPDKLQGSGNITVSEGILWEWNILKGIFGALLIPEFQNIIFTDAHADLAISDGKVSTTNATMVSKTVNILGKGWIDFQQNIDMEVNPEFSEISLMQSDSLKKAPTNFLAKSIAVHVTGTLSKPKFRADTSVKKVLQNTTGVITDTIKGVLDEVF